VRLHNEGVGVGNTAVLRLRVNAINLNTNRIRTLIRIRLQPVQEKDNQSNKE
jgi:hypothetical protein